MKRKMIIALLAMLIVVSVPLTASALTYNDIAGEFICQCGCNKSLPDCANSMTCSTSTNIKESVDKMISDGASRGEIMTAMRTNYSDLILGAPPKEGFNWFAYLTPFILVIAGSIGITFVLTGWVKRNREMALTKTEEKKEKSPGDKKYDSKLKDELDDLRW